MKDRGFWLQAYNGGSSAFNRISRGSGVIENLSVSMSAASSPTSCESLQEKPSMTAHPDHSEAIRAGKRRASIARR